MDAFYDYLTTETNDFHHAKWIIENKLAVGRKEPSRVGALDGKYEIHFVSSHENVELLGRSSNINLDFIPPDKHQKRVKMPCITIYKSMEHDEYAEAILSIADKAAEILTDYPDTSPSDLILKLSNPVDYLSLILDNPLMSINAQRGLIGEIQFLMELINRCGEIALPADHAINSWKNEARDFNRNGITFEVKSSGSSGRIHTISNFSQLDRRITDEELHVISASVCRDSSGYNLPEWVDSLLNLLHAEHHELVLEKIRKWWRESRGYDHHNDRDIFANEPKFTSIFELKSYRIYPAMREPVELLNFDSFVDGIKPRNATKIQYKLDLSNGPNSLTEEDFTKSIDKLLT